MNYVHGINEHASEAGTMWRSRRSLKVDIERWRQQGWVTSAGAEHIMGDLATARAAMPAAAMGLLGAVLFGFAAMSFVAANWQVIPRVARLALLVSAMGGAYGLAAVLFERGKSAFADAATLAGTSLFGVNIMLIAQMYHIDGNPPDAVLVWAIGALATGVIVRSKPALALSLALVCLWGEWETVLIRPREIDATRSLVYWPFLLGWSAVTAAMATIGWRNGLVLAAGAMSIFIVSLGYLLPGHHAHHIVLLLGLLALASGVLTLKLAPRLAERLPGVPDTLILQGAMIAAAGLYAGQFLQSQMLGGFGVWAALGLALTTAAIWGGIATDRKHLARLGYMAFSIEVLTIYFKTVATLLGSAGFFLLAGLTLIALAAIAVRLNKVTSSSAQGTTQ